MKIAAANWYPYRHQATALRQLMREPDLAQIDLRDISTSMHNSSLGPFLVLIDDLGEIVGLPAIVEALQRRFPKHGFLGADSLARARVRALSAKIEECFSRLCIGDIATHKAFGRKIWSEQSDAPQRILEEVPQRLAVLELYQARSPSRFIVGDRPSLADALLAALWWTVQDQGMSAAFLGNPWLTQWSQRNCNGDPFKRDSSIRREL